MEASYIEREASFAGRHTFSASGGGQIHVAAVARLDDGAWGLQPRDEIWMNELVATSAVPRSIGSRWCGWCERRGEMTERLKRNDCLTPRSTH